MDEILDLGFTFGLLSRPHTRARETAFVLLNAGAIHRSGPFRLGPRLGRALGKRGFAALRFDLPGVGDTLASAERPIEDLVCDVLDRLEQATGCRRFVIGGICAASDLGWRVALKDARVAGVLMLDGLARTGFWFQFARWKRLLGKSPTAWFAALRRRASPAHSNEPPVPTPEEMRDWPAPGEERGQLDRLLARGVAILSIFTGSTSYFLHPRQFRAGFGPGAEDPRVDLEFWTASDHTFYSDVQRARLIERVGGWMEQRFAD